MRVAGTARMAITPMLREPTAITAGAETGPLGRKVHLETPTAECGAAETKAGSARLFLTASGHWAAAGDVPHRRRGGPLEYRIRPYVGAPASCSKSCSKPCSTSLCCQLIPAVVDIDS